MKTYFEMSEPQFRSRVRGAQGKVVYGQGVKVDTHDNNSATKRFNEVLSAMYPDYQIQFIMMGRYGKGKNGMWEFSATMAEQGHPAHWITETRGYYCIANIGNLKGIFFFPKDDRSFPKYVNDISQGLGIKIKSQSSTENFGEEENKKSRFRKYLERLTS